VTQKTGLVRMEKRQPRVARLGVRPRVS
jgi:hypothetical protein